MTEDSELTFEKYNAKNKEIHDKIQRDTFDENVHIDEIVKYIMNVWFPNFVIGIKKFHYHTDSYLFSIMEFLCLHLCFNELDMISPYLTKDFRYRLFMSLIRLILHGGHGFYDRDDNNKIISTLRVFQKYEKEILNGVIPKLTHAVTPYSDVLNDFFNMTLAILKEFGTDDEKLYKLFVKSHSSSFGRDVAGTLVLFPFSLGRDVAGTLVLFPFSEDIIFTVYKYSNDSEKLKIFKSFKTLAPARLHDIKRKIDEHHLAEIAKFKTDIFTTLPVELSSMILSMSCNHDTIWNVPNGNFYEKANRMIYKLNTV